MNLQEEQIARIAKEMADEIDFQVLSSMLVEDGWSRVTLKHFTSNKNAVDIADWADTHCKGRYMKNGVTYIFENAGDAVTFTLKWK